MAAVQRTNILVSFSLKHCPFWPTQTQELCIVKTWWFCHYFYSKKINVEETRRKYYVRGSECSAKGTEGEVQRNICTVWDFLMLKWLLLCLLSHSNRRMNQINSQILIVGFSLQCVLQETLHNSSEIMLKITWMIPAWSVCGVIHQQQDK